MILDITVPTLPESVPDALLLEWKKSPGSPVVRDEVLVELETDKVVLEVTAPQHGVLKEILKENGQQVLADDVIARIEADAETDSAPDGAADQSAGSRAAAGEAALSPSVRKLVAEYGLDAQVAGGGIAGTGRDGRLTKGDVLAYLEERKSSPIVPQGKQAARQPAPDLPPPPPPAFGNIGTDSGAPSRVERRVPLSRIRARIAERLVEAQQTAAILTTFNEANLQAVMALRKRFRTPFEEAHGARLGMMSFFVKAAVRALRQIPILNASLEGAEVVHHDYYDIGVAVGSARGLVVPVLRDCDRLTFAEIEKKIAEFGEKANTAQLGIEDLSGGTFTITNGGIFGSLMSTPILNPPQSAILGMHKIQERPVAENGEVVIRPMMYLALSYDHRLIDGQDAVRFLVAIKEAVEDPYRLLLDV
uniref:Dihydrolipoyllysine-residue succinyltransferase component of 2-oxoglutarate dehydrogenase complex n=1 Tax=Candidatus Kentrum sp. DK TaxID=2126562 RepID=A0A450RY49_9GAMM|nr:MAG: 2-oxoglutarate dehydrogenase E2 component [Candidatus Kentron sp. DK]